MIRRPRGLRRISGVVEDVEDYVGRELGEPERYELVHDAFDSQRDPPHTVQAEHPAFAGLLTHRHPAAFRVRLPDARIVGEVPIVLTEDRRAVLASALDREQLDKNPVLGERLHGARRLRGPHIALVSQWARNYGHWMSDVLPRLSLLDLDALAGVPVIVMRELEPASYESLELMGIGRDRLVEFDGTHVQVDELILPSLVGRVGHQPAWALEWLRERLAPDPPAARRRIYISRADAPTRKVVNEDEVVELLATRGFEPILAGRLPFRDQLALFSQAETVVGAHGAGLTNLVAARSTTVVELFPSNYVNAALYGISAAMRHPYWYLVCETRGNNDQLVDLGELERTLDAAAL